ncbi:family 16 glycosylhydrolase [Pseudonocardia alaniniphila]|uniref:Family 16 glycosylhydrolase n=1 Tax=Pseudonocardia alaniniphila TaxID=75291 RepID=A0ABS9TH78_9PSEU|nr:family 16 glycosylhydrolase [Pseudonocardia alaniniphila]MCH6167904.1 family 16 glycosylhydrolase [Pseudonocardia alaniniphila]
MSFQELEELVRKYLSTGIAVVVILVAPGTDAATGDALPSEPSIKVIEPGVSGSPAAAADGEEPADTAPDERTGAAGRDPERSSDAGSGDTGSSGSASGSRSQDSGDDTSEDTTDNAPRSTDGSDESSAENDDDTRDDDRNDTGGNDTGSNTGTENDSDESDSSENDSDESDMSSSGDGRGDSASGSDTDSRQRGNEADSDRSGTASRSGSSDSGSDSSDSGYSDSGSDSGSGSDDSRNSAGAGSATGSSASDGTTAAEQHGWGAPNREDDFSNGTDQWDIYDGPGHGGNGTRSPSAVSVEDGILTITGDSSGTTAGMAWNPGQKYGRWEGRVRAPVSDPSYNALLLLWPDAEDFPVGGEIDFMEMMDHTRQKTDIFIHYGEDNSQVNGSVEIDGTEWHNWAVEWTPEAITAYVDGEEWYRTTDSSIFPPGPMHLCIQLDWFPEGDTPKQSIMEVDWVRQYSLDGSTSDTGTTGKRRSASEDDDNGNERGSADDNSKKSDERDDGDEGDQNESPVRELLRRLFSWR